MQDYSSSILFLDIVPDDSSLPMLRTMILDIKSMVLSNISLFYSVDQMWNHIRYRGEFTFLYLLYLVQETELIMKNLLTYLRHKYREEILLYFTDTAKEEVQGDKWDSKNNQIIYVTSKFIEKEDLDDIRLLEAQSFIDMQKKEMEEAKQSQ